MRIREGYTARQDNGALAALFYFRFPQKLPEFEKCTRRVMAFGQIGRTLHRLVRSLGRFTSAVLSLLKRIYYLY
ncbi:MAG: hypothetical protein J1F65_05035 [Clostridiales bacterium]|nr:hypothetical protein [Clostridiales bacterium]